MKFTDTILIISLLFFSTSFVMGQASNYFPQPGFTWQYNTKIVNASDSILTEINTKDSLDVLTTIDITDCYPVLSVNPFPLPATVNYYVSLDGNDAVVKTDLLPSPLDTIFSAPKYWFTLFKFQSGIVPQWTIFEFDTTITVDSLTIPAGVRITGKKISLNENVTVQAGTFTAARFEISSQIGVIVQFVGFVPLYTLVDTFWVGQNTWIIKHTRDAAAFSYDTVSFDIPGVKMELTSTTTPLGVHEQGKLPTAFALEQNYPNPFNPSTVIGYSLPKKSNVTLKIYTTVGKEIATLVNGEQEAGIYSASWNASAEPSGIYFYRLQTNTSVEVRKLILTK